MRERERERERERVRERERERSNNLFSCGKICIEWEKESHIYSNRMRIRRAKIKGKGRDKWRVTLKLRVVERWKGKRDLMVWNSGEKWLEIGRWCGC